MTSSQLPHFNERPAGIAIDTIIVHSMFNPGARKPCSIQACLNVLDACKVSAHYLIDRRGRSYCVVPEEKRAWHAGKSRMPDGRENVNDFSIGIELFCKLDQDFTTAQYRALRGLIAQIAGRHPIAFVLGHEHVARGRKTDPGPRFDWDKLQRLLRPLLPPPPPRIGLL